jgi:hypothetical protein
VVIEHIQNPVAKGPSVPARSGQTAGTSHHLLPTSNCQRILFPDVPWLRAFYERYLLLVRLRTVPVSRAHCQTYHCRREMMNRSVENSCWRKYKIERRRCKIFISSKQNVDHLRLPNKSGQRTVSETSNGHQDRQKLCRTVECACCRRGKSKRSAHVGCLVPKVE